VRAHGPLGIEELGVLQEVEVLVVARHQQALLGAQDGLLHLLLPALA